MSRRKKAKQETPAEEEDKTKEENEQPSNGSEEGTKTQWEM